MRQLPQAVTLALACSFVLTSAAHCQEEANQFAIANPGPRELLLAKQVEAYLGRRGFGIGDYAATALNPATAWIGRGIKQLLTWQAACESPVEWLLGEQVIESLAKQGFAPPEIRRFGVSRAETILIQLRFAATDLPKAAWASDTSMHGASSVQGELIRHSSHNGLVFLRRLEPNAAYPTSVDITVTARLPNPTNGQPGSVVATKRYLFVPDDGLLGGTWKEQRSGWAEAVLD